MLGGEEFLTAIATVRVAAVTEVVGTARLGRRTKDLVKRLRPGDLAIIDHVDLDRVSAEELADSGVRAVVNVSPSSSGRFPNPGPLELVRAGVCLVDAPGADLFEQVADGETLTVRSGELWRNGTRLAEGDRAHRGDARDGARRPAEPGHGGARGVRRQHAPPPARRGEAARRRDRVPAAEDAVPRPARGRRRARAGLQARPPHRAAVHPQLQAGARRRRRRRRRAARDGPEAARDRRRLRLGLRRGAPVAAPSCSCTRTPDGRGARRRPPATARAPVRRPSPRPGSARTSRCCSRTTAAPS